MRASLARTRGLSDDFVFLFSRLALVCRMFCHYKKMRKFIQSAGDFGTWSMEHSCLSSETKAAPDDGMATLFSFPCLTLLVQLVGLTLKTHQLSIAHAGRGL